MQKSLVELSQIELEKITDLAALFFTHSEIAVMMEVNEIELSEAIKSKTGLVYTAYAKGFWQGQVDLRTGVMKMAKAGSSPAQSQAIDFLKQAIIKDSR